MEKYLLPKDIVLFGTEVKTFPFGIKKVFDVLYERFGNTRAYYGLSWFSEDDKIIYYAMAPEAFDGEGNQPGFETLIIPKGEYRIETIHDWMGKTDSIKEVFHGLMGESRPDKMNPAIEWYKSDDEMVCMVKAAD